ncbi:MAG: hydantoinase B/oxoprolinase family protein, partial [Planctomycetota bacterium]
FGFAGGAAGALGENSLTRADRSVQALPGRVQLQVEPGDLLTVQTPGGGGWGADS